MNVKVITEDYIGIINGDHYYLGLNFKGEAKSKYKIIEYVCF